MGFRNEMLQPIVFNSTRRRKHSMWLGPQLSKACRRVHCASLMADFVRASPTILRAKLANARGTFRTRLPRGGLAEPSSSRHKNSVARWILGWVTSFRQGDEKKCHNLTHLVLLLVKCSSQRASYITSAGQGCLQGAY